jgi:ketosteroid isomerase-like protein
MPRRIVPAFAVLLVALAAAIALAPSRFSPAAAGQASPAAASTPCPATTEAENEALVRREFEEGWGQGHLQVLDEVVADNLIVHRPNAASSSIPPTTFATPGPVADAEGIQVLRTDFPDLRVTVEDVIADGDMVAMRATVAGTQADPLDALGAPNTGRPMAREVWMFERVACGKIAEVWVLFDNLTMLRQLGIITDDELHTVGTPTVNTPTP